LHLLERRSGGSRDAPDRAGWTAFARKPGAALAESRSIVTITTPRGAQESFILIEPDHLAASVILFAGGNGLLRLNRKAP
jgi:hypothetical protein